MIGNNEKSGANLRLISRSGEDKKKRIFNAALQEGESVDRSATRTMLQEYFDGADEEEKKPAQYSLFTALIIVLISFYVIWPQFLEVIDISKKQDEIYIPAGGWSPPPQKAKVKEKKITREELIPQLYPEVEDLPQLEEEEVEESAETEWSQLDVQGDVSDVDFGLGGSGGGPVINAGAGGLVPEPELLYRVEPDYPEPARRARVDGFVLLQAIVNEKGDVIEVKVLQTPPARFGFAEKAMEAVVKWKFKPSILNGKPVKVRIRFSVEFNLVY